MSETTRLTILQLNDIHAYIDLHKEMFLEDSGIAHYRNVGGYARIATLIQAARAQNPDGVLVLDNGDTFHGTYPAVASKGEALVPILNALLIDGMTAHWDFAYGPSQFQTLSERLHYPVLANNCYAKESNQRVFPSHTVIERAGLKIGIIGIACHIIDKTMPPHFSTGIRFTMGKDELPAQIAALRNEEQVDLVVVLSHLGFPLEAEMAAEIDGIDVLLSAHTHNRLYHPVSINDTILIQSGCHGSFMGQLELEIEDGKIRDYRHTLIEVAQSIPPDREVAALVEQALLPHQEMLQAIVGQTETALHRYAQLETTMDNLLLESILEVAETELAFSNGWRYGAPIPPGPITLNDLWNIIPTNPPVSTVEITGRELMEMLEENLEKTFARNPYGQMGGYVKRCLGMRMFIKIENPAGTRIQNLFVNDQPVTLDRTYRAAFVTMQGVPEKYGTNRKNLTCSAIDAMRQFIERRGVITVSLRGTVQVV
ncbi:bifunctional metallophosphatase/5'-nucleotidase [Ferroacidibacillus organovorans]|uniref:Bifunctional metallophosphatase/5'-nucleotidase n=1 Tax=Ferroacidibacillus organovorans TaxID=1765683 RepID=A0A1V4EQH6_9BACL|nr:bifunctional metallophosphatase/5'-nucleotidase [Ferroacidibacillus organovorans]OPG15110.1 bifunctional metallophosphatase/5'-nucleotidase [Ferroacidibacillus organovorans]